MKSNSSRRWVAWIAVVAILVNSFAPSISHALAGHRGTAWIALASGDASPTSDICGPSGRTPAPDSQHTAFEHCPYCAPHGASFAVPVQPTTSIVASAGPDLLPILAAPAAPHQSAWTAAQARAPPRSA